MAKMSIAERWQSLVIGGLLLSAGGIVIFCDLAKWEADPNRGDKRMHALLAFAYNLGGKWLVAGIVVAIGLYLTAEGVRRWRAERSIAESADDDSDEDV